MSSIISYFGSLSERQFERLKEAEVPINTIEAARAAQVNAPKTHELPPITIRSGWMDWSFTGDLNSANYAREQTKNRRYCFYSATQLLAMAAYSVAAIIGVALRTIFSAVMVFVNLANKKGLSASTDPLLENSINLCKAIAMIIGGTVAGVVKLAASLIVDPYTIYQENQERANNPEGNTALIVVDVQRTFCKGGNLAVTDGDAVIPPTAKLMTAIKGKNIVVASQDWHPAKHTSFAVHYNLPALHGANVGIKKPSPTDPNVLVDDIATLWAAHGIQGTQEAEFADGLPLDKITAVFRKGYDKLVDSYSAFFDNGKLNKTPLDEYLQGHNVKKVIVTGLAKDYCCKFTAIDAQALGYETYFVEDATREVIPGNDAVATMTQAGIHVVQLNDILINGDIVLKKPVANSNVPQGANVAKA